ncbi:MAG: DUF6391 domain-containing protein [Anaerolineae bacterium]|nr:DUF6391 domain-containing protein [Anaerolineae bacterium]
MVQFLAIFVAPLLNLPLIRRIRRNHGFEHATIHVLSRKVKNLSMAGRATNTGFFLYGNVPTEEIEAAVLEALQRMKNGEHRLAIHPNCGTGLVTAGFMTSITTMLVTAGMRNTVSDRLSRLPSVILLSTLSLILAQPLGLALQEYFTTLGEMGDMEIVSINRSEFSVPLAGQRLTVHFVRTRSN